MNEIVFENVCKSYGNVEVIKNLNLTIPSGRRLVLLGPSGCGKSTTLRMIAGLESITSGDLYMGGTRVNDLESGDRNVAMVFQNYALYPHMTVGKNICFGMQIAKIPKAEQEKRLTEALEILGLTPYRDRFPRELSGGQRQRVALARAIVKRSPYFLLDEPLSNLDAQLRTTARAELVKIHEVYQPTFVYVTHDQVEAMTIGHQIALMNNNVIQQMDTPDMIYNQPVNTFVGKFIGSPSMNIVPVKLEGNRMSLGGAQVQVPDYWMEKLGAKTSLEFGLRPEHVWLSEKEGDAPCRITYVENHGNRKCISFQVGGDTCYMMTDADFETHDDMWLQINWRRAHFFDGETHLNVGYPVWAGGAEK